MSFSFFIFEDITFSNRANRSTDHKLNADDIQ